MVSGVVTNKHKTVVNKLMDKLKTKSHSFKLIVLLLHGRHARAHDTLNSSPLRTEFEPLPPDGADFFETVPNLHGNADNFDWEKADKVWGVLFCLAKRNTLKDAENPELLNPKALKSRNRHGRLHTHFDAPTLFDNAWPKALLSQDVLNYLQKASSYDTRYKTLQILSGEMKVAPLQALKE